MNLINPYIIGHGPVNTVVPVISGTGTIGNTLTTTNGTWSGSPSSFTYQWRINGIEISGKTASTLLLDEIEIGNDVTCTVTAINGSGNGSATSNIISVSFPAATLMSNMFTDNFNRASPGSNYSVTAPDVTFSQNGSFLRAARTTTGGFANYIQLISYPVANKGFLSEAVTFTLRFYIVTHSVGMSLGWKSLAGNSPVDYVGLMNTGPSGYTTQYQNGVEVGAKSSLFAWAAGDHIELKITRIIRTVTVAATRLNGTVTTRTATFNFPTSTGSTLAMSVSEMALFFHGGTYDLESLTIDYGLFKYSGVAFVGDSITQWYFASVYTNRFAALAMTGSTKQHIVMAGQGMRTADLLLGLEDLRLTRPNYAILLIGTNDYGTGVTNSVFLANLELIISTLTSYGIRLVLLLITPRNTINFNPATVGTPNYLINQTYGSDSRVTIIDTYTDLKAASGDGINASYSTDGLHPNDSGETILSNKLRAAIPAILGI